MYRFLQAMLMMVPAEAVAFHHGIDGNPASLYGVHGGQGGMDIATVGKNVEPDGNGGYTELHRS